MLTRRGLIVVTGGVVMAVTGRLLGILELFAVASALVAITAAAYLYVRVASYSISATRHLRPARVHAGGSSRVELTVGNSSGRRSPVLTLKDPFDGGRRWARFPLAPLAPGETARAAYRLPTADRGIFRLGPLEVALTDPFGLATRSRPAAGSTTLTVYPHIDPIAPMPRTTGPDPTGSATHPNALTLSGEEFYALREYQTGDDLRRVHWPSTARLDEIMIRQDELPWQGRAPILVDLRRQVHSGDTFEVLLSAAASIANSSWRSGSLVRLVSTAGFDSDFGSGQAHLDLIFEQLAAATPHSDNADFTAPLATLRRRSSGGALAVMTTSLTVPGDLQLAGRLRGRYGSVIQVIIEPGTADSAAGAAGRAPRATAIGPMIRASTSLGFAAEWNGSMMTSAGVRAGTSHGRRG